ncbi:hypothetical protein Ancab_032081 [Ancistrocladus abbreviatus]
MVDSPVCQPTAPMDIAPLEQSAVQTEMNRRRQFRKKRLEDILSSTPRNSKTGKSNKCKSRYEVDVVSHSEDILLLEAAQPESDSWLAVNDSQILNMNRLHGTTRTPRQSPPRMTPQQIWDFIEQIGVRDKTNIEDVVRRIGEMEQRDWMAFQKLASAGQQNDARREFGELQKTVSKLIQRSLSDLDITLNQEAQPAAGGNNLIGLISTGLSIAAIVFL